MLLLYIILKHVMTEKKLKSVYNKIKSSDIYDLASVTPLDYAKNLSKKLKNKIYIKRDDLQPVFSFKLRGAYNKILSLKKSKNISQIRSNIGMVFQHFELYPHLSVLNNITLAPIQVKGLSKNEANKKAFKLLERVGIDDQANKYPSELSGGQQQRAAISRALALEPKLMLFDEPTSALDPEMISEVLKVMRDLADNGMSMLVVTHEMGFARDVADEVVFMDEGKIIERSSSKSFFENPQSERAKEFINKVLLKI